MKNKPQQQSACFQTIFLRTQQTPLNLQKTLIIAFYEPIAPFCRVFHNSTKPPSINNSLPDNDKINSGLLTLRRYKTV